jgi:hypothetical protein
MRGLAAVVVVVACLIAATARADETEIARARSHFDAGVAFLEDPDGARYEEAYAQFKRSYELSRSPVVLGNLALCAMKLERDGEAIDGYARYLAEVSDIDPDERRQTERDLETLRVSAAHVEIVVDIAGTAQITDTRTPTVGAPVRNVYAVTQSPVVLRIRPGHHALALRVDGVVQSSWEVEVAAGDRLTHTFLPAARPAPAPVAAPVPAPEPPHSEGESPSLAGPLVLLGLGGAGAIAGAILGAATLARVNALEARCPDGHCPPGDQAEIDGAHDYVVATDFVFLGSGIVAAGGLAWLIGALAGADANEGVDVACGPAGCFAGYRARF